MRKVLKPIVLSNGQTIPAGVTLEVAAYPQSRDPEPYPEPERWDGLRFYRMREAGEDFNNTDRSTSTAVQANAHNQLVSVSHRSLSFGYGRHACPGRFFAANEIKMIVARCLLEYDIKLPDGVSERFPNHEVAGGVSSSVFSALLLLLSLSGSPMGIIIDHIVSIEHPGPDQESAVQGGTLKWRVWMRPLGETVL